MENRLWHASGPVHTQFRYMYTTSSFKLTSFMFKSVDYNQFDWIGTYTEQNKFEILWMNLIQCTMNSLLIALGVKMPREIELISYNKMALGCSVYCESAKQTFCQKN